MDDQFIPFDDTPKERIEDDDAFRISSVISSLAGHLKEALKHKGKERQLRIGLFGGLGQGKSTVIHALKQEMKEFRFGLFDVALHKSDVLEYEFDRLVGQWEIGRLSKTLRKIIFVSISVLLAWLWFSLIEALDTPYAFFPALITIMSAIIGAPLIGLIAATLLGVVSIWKTWTLLFRTVEAEFNFGHLIFSIKKLRELFSPPDVLVVDNLDRASVEQQRSILRAIYKFGSHLHYPIVIVLDESELLQPVKPGENDSPQDLLRKVIQIECRLPLRTAEDVARIVLNLTEEGHRNQKQPKATWGKWLNDIQLLGDWVRTFSLIPNATPRRIKRFLNNLISTCQELGVNHPDDGAALTRLLSLFELHPTLRASSANTLVDAMAANDIAKLTELLKFAGVDPAPNATRIYFEKTRHMRPHDGSWRHLVRRLARRDESGGSSLFFERLRLISLGFPDVETGSYLTETKNDDSTMSDQQVALINDYRREKWGNIEAIFSTALPLERHQLYLYVESKIKEEFSTDALVCSKILGLLYRLRAGDVEVSRIGSSDDWMDFLQSMFQQGHQNLIRLVQGSDISLVDRMILATHPDFFKYRDVESLLPWLSAKGDWREEELAGRQLFVPSGDPNVGLVSMLWPPFSLVYKEVTDEDCFKELQWHLTALATLRRLEILVIPRTLQEGLFKQKWMRRQIKLGLTKDVLKLLTHLFPWVPDGDQSEKQGEYFDLWSPQVVDALFEDYPEERDLLLDALSNIVEEVRDEHQSWWAAIIMGTHYQNDRLCQAFSDSLTSQGPPRGMIINRFVKALLGAENAFWKDSVFTTEAILNLFGKWLSKEGFPQLHQFTNEWENIAQQVHNRLCRRRDYIDILDNVSWTPLLPDDRWSGEKGFPPDTYIRHLNMINKSKYLLHKIRTSKYLLELNQDVAIRNRSLVDAHSLLTGRAINEKTWTFTDILQLEQFGDSPEYLHSLMNDEEAVIYDIDAQWNELAELIEKAKTDTPPDFEQLIVYLGSVMKETPELMDLERFYLYLPYLTLNLPEGSEGSAIAKERLRQYKELAVQCEEWVGEEIERVVKSCCSSLVNETLCTN